MKRQVSNQDITYIVPISISKYKGIAYLDFETVDIKGDVCQIGLKVVNLNNKNVFEFSRLVKPFDQYSGIWFPGTSTHDITWSDVKNENKFDVIWKQIEQYFNGEYLILAHNASFDIKCLKNEFIKYNILNIEFDYGCTYIASKKVLTNLKKHKLEFLANYYNINYNAHDALEDVLAMKKIFEILFKDLKGFIDKNNKLDFKIKHFK